MKTFILAALVICAGSLFAGQTEVVDGVEWSFTIANGQASIGGGTAEIPAIPATTSGNLTIPSTLGGYPVTSIGSYAFCDCSSLTSVVIPEGVTSIGKDAFLDCSSLASVVIPKGMTSIGEGAFAFCSSLTSVEIPKSVTSIGDSAFQGCSLLTSVVIPEGVTSIEKDAFRDCSSLASVVIPKGVTSIGGYAFSGCSSLTSVVIPEGVTVIDHSAFQNCSSLTSVVIPEGVTVKGYAFYGCSSLTSVVFPESVTSIAGDAFWKCSSLTVLQFQGLPLEAKWIPVSDQYVFVFPLEYSAAWKKVLDEVGINHATVLDALVIERVDVDVHAEMPTPKTMKVSYTVTSDLPSVKVRAVAFKDGVRSFANIVPVRTGEGVPRGESVETNVEHTFVWEVANDWDTDLDKVAVEILVQGDTLLPQEQITIPATETHKAMTITRNVLKEPWLFDALVWCVAEGDERLLVQYGRVSVGNVDIAFEDKLPTGTSWDGAYNSGWKREATALLNYLYGKMGYKVLAGEDLAYAERATRLDFVDESGKKPLRQVSVKIDEGE